MPRAPALLEHRVRRAVKVLDFTLSRVEGTLSSSGGNFDAVAKARGFTSSVRVVMRVRGLKHPESWAMSILLNNQRIDGIDWEAKVADHRGKKHDCTGWHRHLWNPDSKDTLKECLPAFRPATVRDFLTKGFDALNVVLKGGMDDASNGQLSFDQTGS